MTDANLHRLFNSTAKAAQRQAALAEAELFRKLFTEYSRPVMSRALRYLEQVAARPR